MIPSQVRRHVSTARLGIAPAVVVLALAAALIDVSSRGPRINIRWRADLDSTERVARERQYGLRNAVPHPGSPTTWQYDLEDRSRDNIRSLVADPAVEDTYNVDRDALAVPAPEIRITIRSLPFPFSPSDSFRDAGELFQPQSLWLLFGAGVLLWGARAHEQRHRRNVTAAVLVLTGLVGSACPIPRVQNMGDAQSIAGDRAQFDNIEGIRQIRFDAHLTHAVMGRLDRLFGRTEGAPALAQRTLASAATAGFVLFALAIGPLCGPERDFVLVCTPA